MDAVLFFLRAMHLKGIGDVPQQANFIRSAERQDG